MSTREINAEQLIGRRVYALNGRNIGRLQEIVLETRGGGCYVAEYLVGTYGLFERLAASAFARAVLKTLRLAGRRGGYRVPWQALDVTDPVKPRLRTRVEELQRAE